MNNIFQTSKSTSTEEIEKIKKVINNAKDISDGCGNTTDWTTNLNKAFIDFAHSKKFKVYSKTRGSDWTEWLYDITICKQTDDCIDETYLVAESEWSMYREDIWYDFQKLLLCNSKYKVMIFQQKTADDRKKMFADIRKQIESYKTCNGIFILACFVEDYGYDFEIVDCNEK